ncbi:CocE/NonD family hydrolase [Tautonia sp. JC769]|uniref:alpha/beta hydrolase family protein n=1 Tax=Tautonia sp. JC769 TaxID=3232135 RepID=UPI00345841FD
MIRHLLTLLIALLFGMPGAVRGQEQPLAGYFSAEVERITAEPLLGIDDAETWKARRPELQARLMSMLGLDPMPERTDLKVEVRGIVERPDFVVERILYQSSPGLYVTANLYRPKEVTGPLPAILYVCGHANVVRDGVIYGCKAHYQHHAAWYAANGYVCLLVDTLQLGEIPGLHHGTYREGKWWWQGRGYTPAGIEVWNGIRGLDYLQSRPEVDPDRLGVTGRSGGGAISWYMGAVDDRLSAVIPVAGITDLKDHLLKGGPTGAHPNGVIEGHCDCMYMVNTDAWDFDVLAALVAPKALLIENTDADPIFPVPGIRRIYDTLETVYEWYDASDRLGLVIGEGGHKDTVEIRHPSFAFMNTWLKGEPTDPSDIEEPDRKVPIEELKVLDVDEPIPADALNARIDETFVPEASAGPVPDSAEEWESLRSAWLDQLRSEVFGGWPSEEEVTPLEEKQVSAAERDGVMIRRIAFTSQDGVRLDLWMLSDESGREQPSRVNLVVLPDELARPMVAALGPVTEGEDVPEGSMEPADWLSHYRLIAGEEDPTAPIFLVCPRGTGTTAWPEAKETHIRRRFALIGQTLDGMRVWDLRRAIAAVGELPGLAGVPVHLTAAHAEAPIALWASVFEPDVAHVRLRTLPASYREGPIFLNLDRILEPSQALGLLYPRPVTVDGETDPAAYEWASELAEALGHDGEWPKVVD